MLAAERRKMEQEELKASRIKHILECTYDLFSNGIDPVTMDKIAENAEIGVASLYRYFSTKDQLAIEVATFAWKREEELFQKNFDSEKYSTLSGIEQLHTLLNTFPELFKTEGKFFRFIYYFDAYIKRQSVPPQQLTSYEATIMNTQKMAVAAIAKGKQDGTIHTDNVSDEELYFTVTHAIFSLAQKLSLSGEMLYMDKDIPELRQLELLVDLILNSLKK
jgi:AcrR family transcriptional regulator